MLTIMTDSIIKIYSKVELDKDKKNDENSNILLMTFYLNILNSKRNLFLHGHQIKKEMKQKNLNLIIIKNY